MVGIARYFNNPENGSILISDWLSTGIYDLPQPGASVTFATWVTTKNQNIRSSTIIGASRSFGGSIEFGIIGVNNGAIFASDGTSHTFLSDVDVGVAPNKTMFIAAVSDAVLNEVRYYTGTYVSNIELVDTNTLGHLTWTAGQTLNPTGLFPVDIYIGGRNRSNAIDGPPITGWVGVIDQVACWYDKALTLSELKEFAGCGIAHANTSRFYYRIVGTDPESDSSVNNNHAGVINTTIVDGICGGVPPPVSTGELYCHII